MAIPSSTKEPDPATGHLGHLSKEQEYLLFQLLQRILQQIALPESEQQKKGKSKSKSKKAYSKQGSGRESPAKTSKNDELRPEQLAEALNRELSLSGTSATISDAASTGSSSLIGSSNRSEIGQALWDALGKEDIDSFFLRFLRARKWDLDAAFEMAIDCLQWRHDRNIRNLLLKGESLIKLPLLQSGKSYFYGCDSLNRLIGWIHVSKHDKNMQTAQENEEFTIFQMEIGRLLFPKNSETVTMVFDMSDFSLKCMDYPSLKFLVTCMQNFYPESLGTALVLNAPWIFSGCWKIIKPWLDPVVVAKVKFVKESELKEFIPLEYLPAKYGGNSKFFYKYDGKKPEESLAIEDSPLLDELKSQYESFQKQFQSLTRQIADILADGSLNENLKLQQLQKERNSVKEGLSDCALKITRCLAAPSLYERSGVLQENGTLDWRRMP